MTRRRYELTEHEWSIISLLLPNKPRGVPRVDDSRVLNGILWRFRTGSTRAEIPERYGPPTTCYNRFVRWRMAGVLDRLFQAVPVGYDGDIVMIDSTCVRVHQHGATGKRGMEMMVAWDVPVVGLLAKSMRLLMRKVVPLREPDRRADADSQEADALIETISEGDILLADKGYDTNAIRAKAAERKAWTNIPPKTYRKVSLSFPRGFIASVTSSNVSSIRSNSSGGS